MNPSSDPFREETLDLKLLFRKYAFLWPWFVASIIVSLIAVHLINTTSNRIYETSLSLLIHEDEPVMSLESQLSAQPFSLSTNKIQNEIGLIKSRTLTYQTIKRLPFWVSYYEANTFNQTELYPNPYFEVEVDSLFPVPVNQVFSITYDGNGIYLVSASWDEADLYSYKTESFVGKSKQSDIKATATNGEWIIMPDFRFRIVEKEKKADINGQSYNIVFHSINSLVNQYREIKVTDSKNSSIILLSIQGENRRKNTDFLNTLAERFLMRDLEKREQKAQKTIDFIDEQITEVSKSLFRSETQLEQFRSSQKVINIDYQSMQEFGNLERLQNEKAILIIKEKYFHYLTNYLELALPEETEIVPPSSMGIDDPLLTQLINDLVKLYSEKSDLMVNSRRDNPLLTNLQSRITNQKNTIAENLKSLTKANTISIKDIDNRIEAASRKISEIPESQRQLFNIERQFNLDDAIYTFLQNKKAEMQIVKSGFTPLHEIIDPANIPDSKLISPKAKVNYIIALLIGLLIPILCIAFYEFFNDKVSSPEDLEKITDLPLLGYIIQDKNHQPGFISYNTHNILAESFRSVRTNTQFVLPAKEKPVILITSTLLGEGKTFFSINLSAGFANLGKKVILLSFDLRKPKTHKYLNITPSVGLSNYLSSDIYPEAIINKNVINNLDVIFSGQIPPNPTELVASQKTNELFDYLKDHYDMIVIDSPPVGMAPDSLLLLPFINTVLYLVRHQTTHRKMLEQTLKNLKIRGFTNINLVLNGLPKPSRFSYYSSYGYHYGYYDSEKQKQSD